MAQPVTTEYPRGDLQRALTNSATTTAFIAREVDVLSLPATVDSGTPTSNAFFTAASGAGIMIIPFLTDTEDDACDYRVYGVDRMLATAAVGDEDPIYQYHYTFALEFNAALDDSIKGVANGLTVATDFYCDTITPDVTNVGMADYQIISPAVDAANLPAAILIRNSYGFKYWAVDFNVDDAITANFLYRMV